MATRTVTEGGGVPVAPSGQLLLRPLVALSFGSMKGLGSRWQPSQSPPKVRQNRRQCMLRHPARPQGSAPSTPARPGLPTPAAPAAAGSPPVSARAADLESDLSATLSLANIRQSLIRQEDTIIFSLIERAQFARNDAMYQRGGVSVPGYLPDGRQYTFLEYLLRETEQVHGKIRRYTSPDEHAYFPDCIPPLVIPPISFPKVLAPCSDRVNINEQILSMYLEHLLPEITQPGDDHNYGSAAMYDVMILQALSKRIHYGKFVAEAKFQAQPEKYTQLIGRQDAQAILDLLTDRTVELKVVERVRRKAATFGQDLDALSVPGGSGDSNGSPLSQSPSYKVKPEAVAELYERWVMPLTKEVEVQYLLQRLDD